MNWFQPGDPTLALRALAAFERAIGPFRPQRPWPRLDPEKRSWVIRRLLADSWLVVLVTGMVALAILAIELPGVAMPRQELPPVSAIAPLPQSSTILDRNGDRVAMLHAEQNRIVVPLRRISRHLRDAVIAIEDHRFYEHNGLNLGAIARAALANLGEGKVAQGGSTISQQYVRNVFPEVGRGRTFERKLREAMMALELERHYEKNEILERYLNAVYFGRGAYGAQAAARAYFGVPASRLRLDQAALLAGLIQSPEVYGDDRTAARARRNRILDRMTGLGMITGGQAQKAKRRPLRFTSGAPPVRAAYFVEHVRRVLKAPGSRGGFGLTDEEILGGGLTIRTTLDLRAQEAAERAVAAVLDRRDDPEAALVAMSTDGQILAMVGGRRFNSIERARGFNFATQRAPKGGRQAGSAFKPFTLAAYLDEGLSPRRYFSAPSRITVPECPNGDEGPWRPANYDNQGYGSLSVVDATAKSVNTVYAQMVARAGPENAVRMARAAGITSPLDPVCSISLGTFGVTPLEMARAYATFAARGARPDVLAVTEVRGPDGKLIARRVPRFERTMDMDVADTVNEILQVVMRRGTGTPAAIARPAAGKTGTTEERRDVWFAGHTPHPGISAAVWIGYPPDRRGRIKRMSMLHGRPATGGYFAGRIWKFFMQDALEDADELSFPDVSLRWDDGATRRWYTTPSTRSFAPTDRDGDSRPGRRKRG